MSLLEARQVQHIHSLPVLCRQHIVPGEFPRKTTSLQPGRRTTKPEPEPEPAPKPAAPSHAALRRLVKDAEPSPLLTLTFSALRDPSRCLHAGQ